jgi:hypothetical protein
MPNVQNTKVALAAEKLDLHRSSPYTTEITSPDGTRVFECGDKIVNVVELMVVQSVELPSVPEWIEPATATPIYLDGLPDKGIWK